MGDAFPMNKLRHLLTVMMGFLIFLSSLYGFFILQKRAGLPVEIKEAAKKQELVQIDEYKIETEEDIEFVLSRKNAGDLASFSVKKAEGIEESQDRLIAFYSQAPFPLIYLTIGLLGFLIGFIVFILRPHELRARIFFWCSMSFSFSLIVNGGFFCLRESWISYIPGILFYIFYPLAPALLLHFSLTFYRSELRWVKFLLYLPTAVFVTLLEYFFLVSSITSSIHVYRQYQSVFFLFRFYVVFYIILTIFTLSLSYKKADLEEKKAQIKWILYGLFLGVGPFIFLYQLPKVLLKHPIISEEVSGVFFVFIPLAFAFSIIKFKLMNIELIINRSLVYSILTVFTVSIYLLSIEVLQSFFSEFFHVQQTAISVAGALAAAVAFHPARKKIQEWVDKSFFRISYDYRKSLLSFNEQAHKIVRKNHLVDFFVKKVKKTIPLEHLGLLVYLFKDGNQNILLGREEDRDLKSLGSRMLGKSKILARRKGMRTELGVDFSEENLIEERNLEMLIPMPFRSTALAGFMSVGRKKSGSRFTRDDIEMLLTMAEALALNLERIQLQEEVIYERAEKEKYDEISRLKTEFVSNVSHEIRTPMSSIQGMSEILQQGKIKGKKKQEELLSLMTRECSRLSQFLHNILDFGKIEQKMKEYHFERTNVCPVVEEVLEIFQYRLESLGFSLTTGIPKNPLFLNVDRNAFKQALTNLLDNAIKYSSDKREISVHLAEKNTHVEIHVKDSGIGIPERERGRIFSGFYRTYKAKSLDVKGVGLGLKIVKHIVQAHEGEIRLKSRPGKGSTFILIFPKP
jgi:signal transduction histidine kinase